MVSRTYRPLQMHRIACSDLAEAQVTGLLRPAANGPSSRNPFSSTLAGMKLKILTDDGGPLLRQLQGNSTIEQMARLQGHCGDVRRESGRIEARHEKTRGQWRVTELQYVQA